MVSSDKIAGTEALRPAAMTVAQRRAEGLQKRISRHWYAYLMLLPSLGLVLLFVYYPTAVALVESFFNWDPGIKNDFVGLYNYRRVLTDGVFWRSWRNVLFIALWQFTIPFIMPIAVAEAIFNLKSDFSKDLYRVLVLIPSLITGMVVLMLWKWVYSYPDGGLNLVLGSLGLGHLIRPWLSTRETALAAVLFMGFPWMTGTAPLIYFAGLINIPQDVIDASVVDGCSTWRRIICIDTPHIMGQIRMFLILGIMKVLKDFGGLLALTRGGPNNATMVPGLYLYKKAFGLERWERAYTSMGQACAVGVIVFIVIFVLTFITNRYARTSGLEHGTG